MTVSGGDEFPDAFYGQEGRMAFIAMPDRGIDAQGAQDPHAADPEQKLLTEPDFLVSTVEPRGEGAIFGRVFRHIGIDEIEDIRPLRTCHTSTVTWRWPISTLMEQGIPVGVIAW